MCPGRPLPVAAARAAAAAAAKTLVSSSLAELRLPGAGAGGRAPPPLFVRWTPSSARRTDTVICAQDRHSHRRALLAWLVTVPHCVMAGIGGGTSALRRGPATGATECQHFCFRLLVLALGFAGTTIMVVQARAARPGPKAVGHGSSWHEPDIIAGIPDPCR